MGPGKPYWNMPDGSTGGTRGTFGSSRRIGTGGGGVVRDASGGIVIVAVGIVCISRPRRPPIPKSAAVVAAPTAADAPATIASVNFDMAFAGGGVQAQAGSALLIFATACDRTTARSSSNVFQTAPGRRACAPIFPAGSAQSRGTPKRHCRPISCQIRDSLELTSTSRGSFATYHDSLLPINSNPHFL